MRAEPRPKKSLVEARTMPNGIPTPVVRVMIEANSSVVIAAITEVSLKVAAVARRLKRLVSLSRSLETSLVRRSFLTCRIHHRAVLSQVFAGTFFHIHSSFIESLISICLIGSGFPSSSLILMCSNLS